MLVMPAQVQQYNAGHHLRVQQPQDRTYVGPTSQQSPHACHTQQPYMDVGPNGRRFLGEYELLETLGKGMSGKVKKACHVQTGEYVALKVIDKSKAVKRTLSQLHTEIVALKSLNHPNILQLHYVELDAMYPKKDGTLMPAIVLALQIADGGELFDFMMYTGHFNEIVSRTLFRQLLSALLFCHERNIYHRDIKPENLLLDDKYQLKIADFGLAAIRQTPEELLRTECGTRSYMAPEILAHREYEGGKADVWSSGVVLFILLAGNPPFQLAKKGDWWFNAVMDGDYDRFWRAHKKYAPHFPPGAQAFLSNIFQADPQLRPSSAEIMKHEWVRGPTLTAAALYREMASRKGEVELEKEREREKAKLEKMQMATGNSGATYDPFTRERAKQRSVGSPNEAEALNMEAPSPPVLEGGEKALKGFTHFYSPLSYTDLMERLHAATGTPETDATNRVKATVPVGGAHVKVEVSVWSLGEVLLVDVQRREGDPILFHRVFKMIKSRVQAPELDPGLSELSVGVSAAGSEEEEMTDDVAMI